MLPHEPGTQENICHILTRRIPAAPADELQACPRFLVSDEVHGVSTCSNVGMGKAEASFPQLLQARCLHGVHRLIAYCEVVASAARADFGRPNLPKA